MDKTSFKQMVFKHYSEKQKFVPGTPTSFQARFISKHFTNNVCPKVMVGH